jgi:hypothetical protein
MIHAEYVAIFMIYLYTKFHIPTFNDSLVIAVTLKAK